MLGEGLRAGLDYLGRAYRCIAHVEREASAAGILAARMESGALDRAPVWSDVRTFDARRWRRCVDFIVAGFPCQDLSISGKRAGLDGARSGLFYEVLRIATDSDARFILLENVAGIATATATVMDEAEGELEERAAARVLGELADLGWDAEWLTLPASAVGASHRRERWFCLAWRSGMGHAGLLGIPTGVGRRERRPELPRGAGRSDSARSGMSMADTEYAIGRQDTASGSVCRQRRDAEWQAPSAAGDGGRLLADAGKPGSQGREQRGSCDHQQHRADAHGSTAEFCGLFAPGPDDPRWPDIVAAQPWCSPSLSRAAEREIAEALAAAAEPVLRGISHGLAAGMDATRAHRLRACGNGVVAAQAAAAVVELVRRAGI